MRPTPSVAVIFIGCCLALSSHAQTDFFWSPYDLNQGATNADATLSLAPGQTGSLFLYYTTNGPINSDMSVGAFLDVFTSNPGFIEFSRAETFDFEITDNGVPMFNRWLDEQGGGGSAGETGTLTSNLVNEWHAFTVTGGAGILEQFADQDAGYDSMADAFLFGEIEFMAVAEGSVDVNIVVGDGGFNPGGPDILNPTFGNATIIVAAIPEPNSCLIVIAFSIAGFVRRRRR